MWHTRDMGSPPKQFDPAAREQVKQASRLADEETLSSGAKSLEDMRRENEVFAQLVPRARVDLTAARFLG